MDAAQWYRACADGEREAWECLNGFLLAMARKGAPEWDEAEREDVVQRVLLEAHGALPASRAEPEAWIPHTVLRLKCRVIDLHRRRAAVTEVSTEELAECNAEPAGGEDPERVAALRQTLRLVFATARDELGGDCPRVLHFYFGMKGGLDPSLQTIDDIAARLGVTANNTSVKVHRCLQRLLAIPRVADALEGVLG